MILNHLAEIFFNDFQTRWFSASQWVMANTVPFLVGKTFSGLLDLGSPLRTRISPYFYGHLSLYNLCLSIHFSFYYCQRGTSWVWMSCSFLLKQCFYFMLHMLSPIVVIIRLTIYILFWDTRVFYRKYKWCM